MSSLLLIIQSQGNTVNNTYGGVATEGAGFFPSCFAGQGWRRLHQGWPEL